jgi:ammonium transporter Rh
VCQWSLICEAFFEALDQEFHYFGERFPIGVFNCLNGLFCAGSVMISFGAILGKTTPLQMMVLGFIEPFFYWLNIFVCSFTLDTFDIGEFQQCFLS